ncbi:hypothetical protein BC629DRAFT_1494877 [Irpex lacteus]|nr:hypothetical protein BC629DRAFT_1494877 [Irpex lacteus]
MRHMVSHFSVVLPRTRPSRPSRSVPSSMSSSMSPSMSSLVSSTVPSRRGHSVVTISGSVNYRSPRRSTHDSCPFETVALVPLHAYCIPQSPLAKAASSEGALPHLQCLNMSMVLPVEDQEGSLRLGPPARLSRYCPGIQDPYWDGAEPLDAGLLAGGMAYDNVDR